MFGPSKYPGSNIGGSNAWSGNNLGIFTANAQSAVVGSNTPEAPEKREQQ